MKRKLLISSVALGLAIAFSAVAGTPRLGNLKRAVEGNVVLPNGKVRTAPVQTNTASKVASAANLPYFYSFETATIANDGWLITDARNFMSSNTYSSSPYGDYSLLSNYDSGASRAAWAFSPAVTLTEGTTYYVSIYVYAPGYSGVKDEFKITVGSAQTAATQTTVIIDKSGANATTYSAMTKVSGSFTATASGDFYFGINHCTVAKDVNLVAFDAFGVSEGSEFVYPPNARIFVSDGGLWSASSATDKVFLSEKEPITYTSVATAATSFLWTFTGDANPEISEDPFVAVDYASAGDKTASFEAVGPGGTSTVNTAFNVTRPAASITDIVWNMSATDPITLYYLTTNNYVVGINSYWKRNAEKFTLPADVTVSLKSIGFYVGSYAMSSTNRTKNVAITLYTEGTDGLPGTQIATYTTTFATLFGTSSITSSAPALKTYTLTTPQSITGSFFVEINFSSYTSTASATNNIGLFSSSERSIDYNTTYVYYQSAWTPVADLTGPISAAIIPNLTFTDPATSGIVNGKLDSNLNVSIQNNTLNVENASIGSGIAVYDLSGKVIYTNVATRENSSSPLRLSNGVYLVKVGAKTQKVVVR